MRFSAPRILAILGGLCLVCPHAAGSPIAGRNETACRKTSVVILGAGVAGVTAAQALFNASVTDFIIVERNNYIGGRVAHTTFGSAPDGSGPYTIELGANWIQGLGSPGGPENPIWTLGKKYNISNTYSNYSSILTYDETGANDYSSLLDTWEETYSVAEENAGTVLSQNLQDLSARTGLSIADWKPRKNMQAQAVEWWSWDWETASPPEQSSFVFGVAGNNLTFNQFSDENNFVTDQQGFNRFVIGEANEFLTADDARLVLEKVVTNITYSSDGVSVLLDDGECIEAEHAICTFSLGVLQNEVVEFDPPLPTWKQEAIESFQMGTYTKIFFQFNETFWDPDTQYFLYADPDKRGRFPVWQSLSTPGFLPDSNIIFATVVGPQSYEVEQQSDEETKADAMEVLRAMFPGKEIPEPVAFTYPRWSQEEWSFGSYSNWPVGVTLERHQNLRANVENLWFAGEANSAEYFGFLHGAWFEGREVGMRVAASLQGNGGNQNGSMTRYEVLHGTTDLAEYNAANGWPLWFVLTCIGTVVCLFIAERIVDFLLFHFRTPAKPLEAYRRRGPAPAYALITGASAGIGYGIAQGLVKNGFGVILLGHKAEELAESATKLAAQVPPQYCVDGVDAAAFVKTILMDAQTATPQEMEDALRVTVIDSGLRVSILVNNVGSVPIAAPGWRELATYTAGEIDCVIDLNTRFMARLTALMMPVLTHNGSGEDGHGMSFGTHRRSLIINLSSAGAVGLPWMVMYGATKAFNLAFSRGLARELELSAKTRHIDCLCVVPGDVRSQGNNLGHSRGSPDSDTYGGYIVNRVDGAIRRGWREFTPFWLHHLQLALVDLIPESARTKGVVDLMTQKKTAWEEMEKSKCE